MSKLCEHESLSQQMQKKEKKIGEEGEEEEGGEGKEKQKKTSLQWVKFGMCSSSRPSCLGILGQRTLGQWPGNTGPAHNKGTACTYTDISCLLRKNTDTQLSPYT